MRNGLQRRSNFRQETIRAAVQAHVKALEPSHVTVSNRGSGDCFYLAVLQQTLDRLTASPATVAPQPPNPVEIMALRAAIAHCCGTHPFAAMIAQAQGGPSGKKGSLQDFLARTKRRGTYVLGELELWALAQLYEAVVMVITANGAKAWYPDDGRSKMVIYLWRLMVKK